MKEILCPQCSVLNSFSAIECRQCHFPFGNLPPSAFVTTPDNSFSQSQAPGFQTAILPVSKTGSRTYLWYRIYCSALALLYLSFAFLGITAMLGSHGPTVTNPQDAFNGGLFLLIAGAIFFIIYLVGILLPPKPVSWIFGIVLIALGMLGICFLPFTLPLIFFWLKPETQRYFGR